jgi:hypothetical protein
MENTLKKRSRGFLLGVMIALLFFIWSLFVFFMVGNKGQPSWDFGVIKDIPGESPYSTNRK